jgi:hypothetical protein
LVCHITRARSAAASTASPTAEALKELVIDISTTFSVSLL